MSAPLLKIPLVLAALGGYALVIVSPQSKIPSSREQEQYKDLPLLFRLLQKGNLIAIATYLHRVRHSLMKMISQLTGMSVCQYFGIAVAIVETLFVFGDAYRSTDMGMSILSFLCHRVFSASADYTNIRFHPNRTSALFWTNGKSPCSACLLS